MFGPFPTWSDVEVMESQVFCPIIVQGGDCNNTNPNRYTSGRLVDCKGIHMVSIVNTTHITQACKVCRG